MLSLTILAAVGCSVVVVQLFQVLRSRQMRGTKQLPGPTGKFGSFLILIAEIDSIVPLGLPLIGSAFELQKGKHGYFWFKFTEWGSEHGPIYQYKAFGKVNVVLGTEKIANELLRERGDIYSSRENLPMASQLLSDNKKALFLPYGGIYLSPFEL